VLAALRKVIEPGWRSIWNGRRKLRCLLDLKPDISCALKSGHFNLLRTPAVAACF
jgi:hypothetical protein